MPKKSASKPSPAPDKLTLRAYNVGFGDCLLLTFHYPGFKRRVLIDFGSSSAPRMRTPTTCCKIAQDIREQCRDAGGAAKLDAVVVTHRHSDHLSGFSTTGDGPGRSSPRSSRTWWFNRGPKLPTRSLTPQSAPATTYTGGKPDAKAFVASLRNMQAVAKAVARESRNPYLGLGKKSAGQLRFLGEDNLANKSAIDNLMKMGQNARAAYVNCGSASGLETVLPGVKVHVLGPPTLEQTDAIRKERSRDPQEFWQFCAYWRFQAGAGAALSGARVFPKAAVYSGGRCRPGRGGSCRARRRSAPAQLLEIVRELDTAMNNTSVILLFEVGGTKLLFPGDAQIENWSYALQQPQFQDLLEGCAGLQGRPSRQPERDTQVTLGAFRAQARAAGARPAPDRAFHQARETWQRAVQHRSAPANPGRRASEGE